MVKRMARLPGNPFNHLPRPSKRGVRVTAIVILVIGTAALSTTALSTGTQSADSKSGDSVPLGTHIDIEPKISTPDPATEPIPANAELTVIATQGFFVSDENAELIATTRDGTLVYHNSSYEVYFDVDPIPDKRYTVEYLASKQILNCETHETARCTRNVIERANLSTGTVEEIYTETTPKIQSTRWHDADRINGTHIAIADVHRDSVRVVNLTSGETAWEWKATEIYEFDGETRPQDWTHLNDVEVIDGGTFMLSMRNQDQVVFVSSDEGYLSSRTLGEPGNHNILYEQHNPDYIPAERGGPAILVSDSENNRVVEYHRQKSQWEHAWQWKDEQLQWPRDADRLPNGETLIVDSHGDRVLEITSNGTMAWSVGVGMPYDAERLGTGDESTTGLAVGTDHKATGVDSNSLGIVLLFFRELLPNKAVNGIIFSVNAIGAGWFGFGELLVTFGILITLFLWIGVEYRWADWSVTGLAAQAYERMFPRS